MEQRTLEAAYRFYCSKELKDAHSAEADTLATWEVLEAQLDRYPELQNDVAFLSEFSNRQRIADLAGFIAYNDKGEEIFTFGKYRGVTLAQVYRENAGYFSWMENGDFPHYTKRILNKVRTKIQLSQSNFNLRS
jgi:DNA polymerase-3 subunit epsilon